MPNQTTRPETEQEMDRRQQQEMDRLLERQQREMDRLEEEQQRRMDEMANAAKNKFSNYHPGSPPPPPPGMKTHKPGPVG